MVNKKISIVMSVVFALAIVIFFYLLVRINFPDQFPPKDDIPGQNGTDENEEDEDEDEGEDDDGGGGGGGPPTEHEPDQYSNTQYNFLVILTDDQRWNLVDEPINGTIPMPLTKREIYDKGIVFRNAYASDPICCPFRSSFLTGGFKTYNSGVLSNEPPEGGFNRLNVFNDNETLAVTLQNNGYETALIGKYINGYHTSIDINQNESYIPPGWDMFRGGDNDGNWTNFEQGAGTSNTSTFATGWVEAVTGKYHTYYVRDQAISFLNTRNASKPFFLYLTVHAPHKPAEVAPCAVDTWNSTFYCDNNTFVNYAYSNDTGYNRAFGEGDLNDKPLFMRTGYDDFANDTIGADDPDIFIRKQLQSLQSVDRMVEQLLIELENRNLKNNTVIFFVSDNGFLWGEHRNYNKDSPYDEAVRIPFAVLVPNFTHREIFAPVTADVDISATIFNLSNIVTSTDGMNLRNYLSGEDVTDRESVQINDFGENDRGFPFESIITYLSGIPQYKYVRHVSGEEELYDLAIDPYEFCSLHNNTVNNTECNSINLNSKNYTSIKSNMISKLDSYTNPPLIWLQNLTTGDENATSSRQLPEATANISYQYQLEARYGTPPYRWRIFQNTLPKGLTINESGYLSGILNSSQPRCMKNCNATEPICFNEVSCTCYLQSSSNYRCVFTVAVDDSFTGNQWIPYRSNKQQLYLKINI